MGRTVQTIVAAGSSSTAGITSAAALTLIRANAGYEYIKTVKLTTTEVAAIEITGLDSSLYSGFRIIGNRLSYGGGASGTTWTVRILTGTNTTDSAGNYSFEGFKFASGFTTNYGSAQSSWNGNIGYGGANSSTADFTMDYNIVNGAAQDANMWLEVFSSKPGGYWGGAGVLTGIHTTTGAIPTGIRIENSLNFRASVTDAYVTVLGLRTRA